MDFISRRRLLAATSAALLPPVPGQTRSDAGAKTTRRLKVVVTGGHPGDPEYGCGGTVARYTDLGHEVVLLYLNRGEGEKGCPEQTPNTGSAVRVPEARKACAILKARPVFADQCDAHAVVDNAHYDGFRRLLEAEHPDVVFTHWPIDQHRDHSALALLVHDAWLRGGKKFALYYYEVGEDTLMFSPTDYVDISATEPRRRAACYAHASQTPDRFYPEQTLISRFRGSQSGYVQAEGFARHVLSVGNLLPGTM